MPKVDLPNTEATKATHRYVTVPDTDMFDMPHPGIRVNHDSFGPGTHYLPTELANTVEASLRDYELANRRILQPRQDANAIRAVNKANGRPMEAVNY